MKDVLADLENTMLPWLGRAMKSIDFFVLDYFHACGLELTKTQLIILRILSKNDGQPQQNLAFLAKRDKTSLTRLINTMERKKLVTRVQSKDDKRINHIYITQNGQGLLKAAVPIVKKAVEEIQKGITKEEIEQTISVLKKISKNVNADELTAPLNH
ncbi:MarR family transcriptional regulator [Reichenbachiella sp. MALMAid0571]|uniref:MarR family winged helix-turn-helix transcriptional regulator n=1 Tax=Reichenbachiella sp. MALMAid0571 TaxID=3143939 RepID=UPI0032DF3291